MGRGRKPTKDDAPENPEELPGWVYIVRRDGRVKIGMTGNLETRLRALSNAAGAAVVVLETREFSTRLSAEWVERDLHRQFNDKRLIGEWFDLGGKEAVTALHRARDPHLHIADYRHGMPPDVACAGVIERWTWCEENGIEYKYVPGLARFVPVKQTTTVTHPNPSIQGSE
jgi:hypothetical protein